MDGDDSDAGPERAQRHSSVLSFASIRSSPTMTYAARRIELEIILLWKQLNLLAFCGFILLYGAMMVFRNLAFYRYEGNVTLLQDLGFEIVPNMEMDSCAWMGDIPIWIITAAMIVMCCFTLKPPVGNQGVERVQSVDGSSVSVQFDDTLYRKPFVMNALVRYVAMLAIGHCLRFISYISTTFPGTSQECLGDVSADQPKSLKEVFFTRFSLQPGKNCGDLLFSGHVLQMMTPVLAIQKYAMDMIEYSRTAHLFHMAFLWTCLALMCVAIVARRHHYTHDVVLGAYVTPLLWHFFCKKVHPKDLSPSSSSREIAS